MNILLNTLGATDASATGNVRCMEEVYPLYHS
jgi:hypothetical protein